MLKHALLIRWHRDGRTVTPILDAHCQCQWPLGPEDNDLASARALRLMADLPKEVEKFMGSFFAMNLRVRYGMDITGPYLINDADESLDPNMIDEFVRHADDATLNKYLFRRQRRAR